MFNFGFVVEHLLGHVTYYQNLRHWVSQDTSLCAHWMPIAPDRSNHWSRVPIIGKNWSLQASLRARDAIRATLQNQPLDALLLHTQTAALFALPLMQHIPTIISTDATPLNYDSVAAGYNHKIGGNALLNRQKFLWNQRTFHAAAAIIAWSPWIKASLVNDYAVEASKVTVIPPAIDLAQWQVDRGSLPGSLADSETEAPVRLLFVGGDFVRKGGQTLLQAFRRGLADHCTLDIVTKDTSLHQELAGNDRVHLHSDIAPNSPQLKQLYANADIFVFPTQADCYPIAIMEAMAAGLPIIATSVGAITEQMEPGINGLTVPVAEVGALVEAISALVNDAPKRRSMAIASRRLAEERFDGRRNGGNILSLLKQLANARTESGRLPTPTVSLPRL